MVNLGSGKLKSLRELSKIGFKEDNGQFESIRDKPEFSHFRFFRCQLYLWAKLAYDNEETAKLIRPRLQYDECFHGLMASTCFVSFICSFSRSANLIPMGFDPRIAT
jgi:hypothetical protein